jgi:hypothetical protein
MQRELERFAEYKVLVIIVANARIAIVRRQLALLGENRCTDTPQQERYRK